MKKEIIPIERIARSIRYLRGEKVLLDPDLAQLYGVTTGNLNKGVNRNRDRFPSDFMFRLTTEEAEHLIFQIGRSMGRGGRRHRPYAFTEQGVAMHGNWAPLGALFLIAFLLNIAGTTLLGIGFIISFPVSLLAIAGFYRSLRPATV